MKKQKTSFQKSELINDLKKCFLVRTDGKLIRKINLSSNARKGEIVGCKTTHGYLVTSFRNKLIYVHRIIFAIKKDWFPQMIDHKDRNRLNNRIGNLRASTAQKNQENRKISKLNKSGCTGVYFCNGKWRAQLRSKWIRYNLGTFEDKSDAIKAIRGFKKVNS